MDREAHLNYYLVLTTGGDNCHTTRQKFKSSTKSKDASLTEKYI